MQQWQRRFTAHGCSCLDQCVQVGKDELLAKTIIYIYIYKVNTPSSITSTHIYIHIRCTHLVLIQVHIYKVYTLCSGL